MGKPRYPFPIRVALGVVLLAVSLASSGFAFEAVLTAPKASKEVEKRLTGASLVFAAQRNKTTDPHDIVASAKGEYRRLLSVLYDEGYFGPVIEVLVDGREAADLPPFETLQKVDVVEIRVDPGPQFHFGLTELGPMAPDTRHTQDFARGQIARTGVIRRAATHGIDGWRQQGHAKAQVSDQSIIADHKDATLNVDIDLKPGPKLRFGELQLSGMTRVPEQRLRSIVSLPSGETFDPDELDKIGKRLRRSGVFRSVSITEAEEAESDGTLDINVRVEDDKPRRISFGAELESRDGLTISAAWIHRNLMGGGERLEIDAEVSGVGGQNDVSELLFRAAFTRPATFQPDTDLGLSAALESIDNDIFKVNKFGLKAGLTRTISDQLNITGGILFESNNSEDDYGPRQFRTIGLSVRSTWDLRDDKLDPTAGTFVSGTFMPFAATKDGESGVLINADTRAYRALGNERVIAAARVQAGAILGPDISEVSPDYLFLSGGGGTVRGQPYESGFVTVGGNRSGGLSFVGFSGELRVKTTETISAVAFYDAGFVGETANLAGDGTFHAGAGVGVRYHTAIGPIRADLGFPVAGDKSAGVQLYIGIGQAF